MMGTAENTTLNSIWAYRSYLNRGNEVNVLADVQWSVQLGVHGLHCPGAQNVEPELRARVAHALIKQVAAQA